MANEGKTFTAIAAVFGLLFAVVMGVGLAGAFSGSGQVVQPTPEPTATAPQCPTYEGEPGTDRFMAVSFGELGEATVEIGRPMWDTGLEALTGSCPSYHLSGLRVEVGEDGRVASISVTGATRGISVASIEQGDSFTELDRRYGLGSIQDSGYSKFGYGRYHEGDGFVTFFLGCEDSQDIEKILLLTKEVMEEAGFGLHC